MGAWAAALVEVVEEVEYLTEATPPTVSKKRLTSQQKKVVWLG